MSMSLLLGVVEVCKNPYYKPEFVSKRKCSFQMIWLLSLLAVILAYNSFAEKGCGTYEELFGGGFSPKTEEDVIRNVTASLLMVVIVHPFSKFFFNVCMLDEKKMYLTEVDKAPVTRLLINEDINKRALRISTCINGMPHLFFGTFFFQCAMVGTVGPFFSVFELVPAFYKAKPWQEIVDIVGLMLIVHIIKRL